jgi:hypothetical protein
MPCMVRAGWGQLRSCAWELCLSAHTLDQHMLCMVRTCLALALSNSFGNQGFANTFILYTMNLLCTAYVTLSVNGGAAI